MGQWYGGRSVPMTGVAAVGVPPEERGSGAAAALMTGILAELRESGVPLSALYASTQRPYRKVGYEQAGHYCRYALPGLALRPAAREVAVRPVTDPAVLRDIHRRWGARNPGLLDRNDFIWGRTLMATPANRFLYLLGEETAPEGYVVYSQERKPGGYDLHVVDWAALTPAAWRTMWAFLADHRSMATRITWYGPAVDGNLLLLSEFEATIDHFEPWMLRVTDVAAALSARGFPAGAEGRLAFDVADPLVPEGAQRVVLEVEDGKANVTPGGAGRFRTDAGGFATLFTGMYSSSRLESLGRVESDADSIAVADRLFAGPTPHLTDHF
jgi:predicted acetyltransferase